MAADWSKTVQAESIGYAAGAASPMRLGFGSRRLAHRTKWPSATQNSAVVSVCQKRRNAAALYGIESWLNPPRPPTAIRNQPKQPAAMRQPRKRNTMSVPRSTSTRPMKADAIGAGANAAPTRAARPRRTTTVPIGVIKPKGFAGGSSRFAIKRSMASKAKAADIATCPLLGGLAKLNAASAKNCVKKKKERLMQSQPKAPEENRQPGHRRM